MIFALVLRYGRHFHKLRPKDEATAQRLRDVLVSQGWDVWRDKEGIVTGTS